ADTCSPRSDRAAWWTRAVWNAPGTALATTSAPARWCAARRASSGRSRVSSRPRRARCRYTPTRSKCATAPSGSPADGLRERPGLESPLYARVIERGLRCVLVRRSAGATGLDGRDHDRDRATNERGRDPEREVV